MNIEQTKALIRWVVTAFGGVAAGYIAGKGWAQASDVLGVVQSDTFVQGVSAIIALISLIWGLFAHSEKGLATATSKMPNVAGVITADTPAGKQLAKAVPDPAVVPAGTTTAKAIAKA